MNILPKFEVGIKSSNVLGGKFSIITASLSFLVRDTKYLLNSLATDDGNTMVASKALNLSLNEDVEVKAEDTDILCLLIHHFSENLKEIVMTTKNGLHSVSKIVNYALDAKLKRILLLIHSFSGCDTVSSIHGFGKETILKKAVSFHEEGHLASLISARVSTNEVIAAGLS